MLFNKNIKNSLIFFSKRKLNLIKYNIPQINYSTKISKNFGTKETFGFQCDKYMGKSQATINYLLTVGNRISEIKKLLLKETALNFPDFKDYTTQETESEFLKMLVKLSNSKRGIEIGTFTGYSALCMAEGLPENGELYCFDNNFEFTNLAKKFWEIAEVDHKIKLNVGNGLEKIQEVLMSNDENFESFDFAYIDADKPNYRNYYEMVLKLLKPNGWIVFDNVLWQYKVTEENANDEFTLIFKELNKFLNQDERVDINMLDIADGITIVRKK